VGEVQGTGMYEQYDPSVQRVVGMQRDSPRTGEEVDSRELVRTIAESYIR
jgi:hypothetical protein